jgi:hypothetical protein
MPSRRLLGSVWLALAIALVWSPAAADDGSQAYVLDGSDAFTIAARQVKSLITYHGRETLTRRSLAGGTTTYHAIVTYDRDDGTTVTHDRAAFALTMARNGDITSQDDADPDYLTILNQPFSIQLDAPTIHDLQTLHGPVPFDFPSPMTGAPLHGTLRRLDAETLDGVRVLGIAFAAGGPLTGRLPDRPTVALRGTITMNGTAYYAYGDALLLALDATLVIDGTVVGGEGDDTVAITYKRSIRPASVEGRRR